MFTKEARKAFTFKRLAILFYRPLIATTAILLLWRIGVVESFLKSWLSFLDLEALTGNVGWIAGFHALVATVTLHGLLQKGPAMYEALDKRDFVRFVRLRDDPIFWPLHVLLFTFSVMLVTGVVLIDYQSRINGYYVITCVVVVITLYWEVAMAADDPMSSRWYDEDPYICLEYRIMTMDQATAKMAEDKAAGERLHRISLQLHGRYSSEDFELMTQFRRRHKDFKP